MKYIKKYETLVPIPAFYEPEIEIGEYVICTDSFPPVKKFISKNIGKCVYIIEKDIYLIQYKNIPQNLQYNFKPGILPLPDGLTGWLSKDIKPEFRNNTRIFTTNNILHHSKNKKDLEIILAADKYNL